jgi:hypothetical protein
LGWLADELMTAVRHLGPVVPIELYGSSQLQSGPSVTQNIPDETTKKCQLLLKHNAEFQSAPK